VGKQKNIKATQEKEKKAGTKAKWKKIAREVGEVQDAKITMLSPKTSKKRIANVENLILMEERSQKRVCDRNVKRSAVFPDETVVVAMQHPREQ